MKITIQSNIPAPINTALCENYPFQKMKIGDSFALEAGLCQNVRSAATQWAKRHDGFKFKTRTLVEHGKSVVRVWRVEMKNGDGE